MTDCIRSHIVWAYAQTCRDAAAHCRISTYDHAGQDAAFYDHAAAILGALANPHRPR